MRLLTYSHLRQNTENLKLFSFARRMQRFRDFTPVRNFCEALAKFVVGHRDITMEIIQAGGKVEIRPNLTRLHALTGCNTIRCHPYFVVLVGDFFLYYGFRSLIKSVRIIAGYKSHYFLTWTGITLLKDLFHSEETRAR